MKRRWLQRRSKGSVGAASGGEEAAVDVKLGAGDVGGFVRGEEQCRMGDLLDPQTREALIDTLSSIKDNLAAAEDEEGPAELG